MASAWKQDIEPAVTKPRWEMRPEAAIAAGDWLRCSPETPWGVHARIADDRCPCCGWRA